MSHELLTYLHARGIATSRTTPYNPEGNGLVERYNGIIWRTINLALKTLGLQTSQWENVLPDVLHSIRSLLCTSTNCTPHERMFLHKRKSTSGTSLPSWLTPSEIVLLKKHVRLSKYDPLVEEVTVVEANPQYALIRHKDGRENTVSLKHLAPRGDINLLAENETLEENITPNNDNLPSNDNTSNYDNADNRAPACENGRTENEYGEPSDLGGIGNEEIVQADTPRESVVEESTETSRRPTRTRRRPAYLHDYVRK